MLLLELYVSLKYYYKYRNAAPVAVGDVIGGVATGGGAAYEIFNTTTTTMLTMQ